MNYTVVFQQELEGGFSATVPVLPGCVSQGETRAETLNNISEAINLYLEDCLAAGEPLPLEAGREFVDITAPYQMA